jgi:hypothetical protein
VNDAERRKKIRRTTLLLVAVALAFFVAFIMTGVLRA